MTVLSDTGPLDKMARLYVPEGPHHRAGARARGSGEPVGTTMPRHITRLGGCLRRPRS